jgi:hypothetical protein
MAINLSDNINTNSPKILDKRYGPWNSIADANANVIPLQRSLGLTVGILSGVGINEYWYYSGVTDSDLIIKTIGGGSGTGSSGTSGSSGSSGSSGADGALNALPLTAVAAAGDYTGFVTGSGLNVSYNWTNRQITLTGETIQYYWRGILHTLTSPWTSSSHSPTVGSWYLMSTDGQNFIWSQTPWGFTDIMVAYVNYRAIENETFAVRETHELMDTDSHEEFHRQIGTSQDHINLIQQQILETHLVLTQQ